MEKEQAQILWTFCYDVALKFRDDTTPAGKEFFKRAKQNAIWIEQACAHIPNLLGGLQPAQDWQHGS